MSEYQLIDEGDGRFRVAGEMTFASADRLLSDSERQFAGKRSLEIDLSDVTRADSAGLALLLEWKARAVASGGSVAFLNVPESVQGVARITSVEPLLAG